MIESTDAATESGATGWSDRQPAAFFVSRWQGRVPLGQLFWWDMLVVGTAINLAMAAVALAMFALKLPTAVGLAVYLSPLPYNVFLVAAVWRASAGQRSLWTVTAPVAAMIWLVAATLI